MSNYGPTDPANYYGCCRCQKHHFEDEHIFQEHLGFQSKDGVKQIPRSQLVDKRLRELEEKNG